MLIQFEFDEKLISRFAFGDCEELQCWLCKHLEDSEPYDIYTNSELYPDEFCPDHKIVKYGYFYVDIFGLYENEDEVLKKYISCKNSTFKYSVFISKTNDPLNGMKEHIKSSNYDPQKYSELEYVTNMIISKLI